MYNIMHGSSPQYLIDLITVKSHSYNLRNSKNSAFIKRVGAHGIHSFHLNASKLWRDLPDDFKTCDKKVTFKIKCNG